MWDAYCKAGYSQVDVHKFTGEVDQGIVQHIQDAYAEDD